MDKFHICLKENVSQPLRIQRTVGYVGALAPPLASEGLSSANENPMLWDLKMFLLKGPGGMMNS